jgi:hypothetical protein
MDRRMNQEKPTIPCKTCGEPSFPGTKECTNCWEVERRLEDYLKSPGGWEFVRKHIPKLDDWVDGKPGGWDYEKILADNDVTVEWCDTFVDGEGNESPAGELAAWSMAWKYGVMDMGQTTETIARKAAALFVSLWLRGVSASFADKLMDGFICFLERQENTSLTFLAEIDAYPDARPYFRLTRDGFLPVARDAFTNVEWRIIEALGKPAEDEEIIVTFTKRKKSAGR